MSFEIKKAVNNIDYALIEKLAKTIWNEHYITILTKEQIDYMLNKFQSEVAISNQVLNDGYEYYILFDECPIGYIAIKKEDKRLFLSKLYILKEERGRGYSRLIFDFLDEYSFKNSLKSIYLTVNKENESSVGVYKHLGFKITDKKKADIGNGFFMDDYIMEKEIK